MIFNVHLKGNLKTRIEGDNLMSAITRLEKESGQSAANILSISAFKERPQVKAKKVS